MHNACKHTWRVSAYHDGELPPQARIDFEAHLRECAGCARELKRLRKISELLRGAPIPDLPAQVLAQTRECISVARDYSVFKMARILTAAAAAILVVCGGWLWDISGESYMPLQASGWEQAAVQLRVETSTGDFQQIAQWIVEDLSMENGND